MPPNGERMRSRVILYRFTETCKNVNLPVNLFNNSRINDISIHMYKITLLIGIGPHFFKSRQIIGPLLCFSSVSKWFSFHGMFPIKEIRSDSHREMRLRNSKKIIGYWKYKCRLN